jgi:hypothetical protein
MDTKESLTNAILQQPEEQQQNKKVTSAYPNGLLDHNNISMTILDVRHRIPCLSMHVLLIKSGLHKQPVFATLNGFINLIFCGIRFH